MGNKSHWPRGHFATLHCPKAAKRAAADRKRRRQTRRQRKYLESIKGPAELRRIMLAGRARQKGRWSMVGDYYPPIYPGPFYPATGTPCFPVFQQTYGAGQTPHKCPVCNGRQTVPSGFYGQPVPPGVHVPSTSAPMPEETCRSCGGQGILWR
jgi:hypothetical protein